MIPGIGSLLADMRTASAGKPSVRGRSWRSRTSSSSSVGWARERSGSECRPPITSRGRRSAAEIMEEDFLVELVSVWRTVLVGVGPVKREVSI